MRIRIRKKVLVPAALALIFGGTALALYLLPREHALLPRARRIVAFSHDGYPFYWWLGDHDLLLFRDPLHRDWTLVRLNETTNAQTPLDSLSGLFARSGGRPDTIQVSPDGEWMLWTGNKGQTIVARTDGAKHFEYPPGPPSEKRWMSESIRWIELVKDGKSFNRAILHNVVDPKASEPRLLLPTIPCTPNFVDLAGMTPTTDDHILTSVWNRRPGNIEPAGIIALALNVQMSRIGRFTLDPPHALDRGHLVFAPIYGRLAWVIEYKPALSRITKAGPRVGLWVTRMNGWESHEVGSLESEGFITADSVRWTPDGTRLSFIYQDALWTVPAD